MEHIITRHMYPVKFGTSCFLSQDVTGVSNLVTQTITLIQNLHINGIKIKGCTKRNIHAKQVYTVIMANLVMAYLL